MANRCATGSRGRIDGASCRYAARFLHIAEMPAEFGPQRVGMPHVRPLEGKLWEMRMTGRDGIARAIYLTQAGRRLTVLHVFVKKTQKTPRRAIETACTRMKEK